PESAWISSRMSANRLDLPLPLGPMRPTFWPGCTFIEASCSSTLAARRRVTLPIRSMGVVDDDRSVVGEDLVVVDGGGARLLRDGGRGDLVVDAPADVAHAGVSELHPPGE